MELALSLGDTSKPLSFLEKKQSTTRKRDINGFCMSLALSGSRESQDTNSRSSSREEDPPAAEIPPLQLDLLPFSPVPLGALALPPPPPPLQPRFPWLCENLSSEPGSSDGLSRGLDVNRFPATGSAAAAEEEEEEEAEEESSPNSAVSSFMEFSLYRGCGGGGGSSCSGKNGNSGEADHGGGGGVGGGEGEKATSRASDDDENGSTRKKLRLSKEQSAFLEESFKEHHTLNPKQKLALAKQLNLRPRQVEVWFQNRRARTKLKQTEVDCEYLKRCCEKLTEENRRLQKELQELRALKTSQPFYMQRPATTLTMCPSCERVATASTAPAPAPAVAAGATNNTSKASTAASNVTLSLAKPSLLPFSDGH
ncbi:homeobox-leucine zipper protein [Dionaea muscipula]